MGISKSSFWINDFNGDFIGNIRYFNCYFSRKYAEICKIVFIMDLYVSFNLISSKIEKERESRLCFDVL